MTVDPMVQFLYGRINLLVIEDEPAVLSMLKETFSLPYVRVVPASSIREARRAMRRPGIAWHCWIVDMCLGGKRNAGSTLIEEHSGFPFAVVYSGLGSMESAAGAVKRGAASVIDKGAASLERLIGEVFGLMPLGVLCRGMLRKKKEQMFLFREHTIRNPVEWAERAGVTLRQMENISITATGLPPSNAIPFYYGLRYLLAAGLGVERRLIAAKEIAFYWKCVEYLEKNQEYYRNMLFR